MNVNPIERPFIEAEMWCKVISKLKKGHKITFCQKIKARISWDWYKAHINLRKANRQIMTMDQLVSDEEFAVFMEDQKIKL